MENKTVTLLLGLIAGLLIAEAALGADSYRWALGSHVTIQPTSEPGAVAEVVFLNKSVHTTQIETFDLTLGDLTVTVEADVGMGDRPDRITVTPPEGYYAEPAYIDVAEDDTGVVLILPEMSPALF